MISMESFGVGAGTVTLLTLTPLISLLLNAVPAIQPSCSALRQPVSKSPLIAGFHVSRTAS